MPGYRPSACLRFVMRLDEGDQTAELLSKLEPIDTAKRSAVNVAPGPLTTSAADVSSSMRQVSTLAKLEQATGGGDLDLRAELERALAKKRAQQRLAAPEADRPDAWKGTGSDDLTFTFGGVQPHKVEVERNGFRTLDKASFTLDYYDAPFDPRIMRSACVEIVIGVISETEWDAGMHGIRREDGTRYSVVEDADGLRTETRFVGVIDKWDIEHGEDGSVIYASAQDLMSLVRDQKLPKNAELDLDVPIEEGIRSMLNFFPSTRGIPVSFEGGGQGPIPASAGARKRKLVGRGKKKHLKIVGENMTLWDYITDVCIGCGVIPVISGFGIVISRARTLFGKNPNVPTMVWGQNLSRLKFSRTMAGFKNQTIEVRSYSADEHKTYAARYPASPGYETAIIGERDFPKQPDRASNVLPSGTPDEQIRVMTIADMADFDRLRAIARGIFEETARQELEVSFSTDDPSFFGEDFSSATLLALKAGDPVRILVDARRQGEIADVVTELQGLALPERVGRLEAAGFRRRVAIAYATLLDSSNLQTIFRTQSARISVDKDEGLRVEVDLCNYIALREDPSNAGDFDVGSSSAVNDATAGQSGIAAQRARAASAARKSAEAKGQAGAGTGATAAERAAERSSLQTGEQLQSDPDQLFSR